MVIIRNKYIPFPGFAAINILGILFCRRETRITPWLINHERIHTAQMIEMGIIFFYIWYVVEWLMKMTQKGCAYYRISFEREAYRHERDLTYLSKRRHYAWWKMMRRRKR
jgi:hypothetical protein